MIVLANILSATSLLEDGYILKEHSEAWVETTRQSINFTSGTFLIIRTFLLKARYNQVQTLDSKVRRSKLMKMVKVDCHS